MWLVSSKLLYGLQILLTSPLGPRQHVAGVQTCLRRCCIGAQLEAAERLGVGLSSLTFESTRICVARFAPFFSHTPKAV